MKRGDLYWVNLEPSHAPEFGKIRPGLIISNSDQNVHLPTVVVLPISTQAPKIWPLRLGFKMPQGRKESFVVVPGIRQVSKQRLQEKIGIISEGFLANVEEALTFYLRD